MTTEISVMYGSEKVNNYFSHMKNNKPTLNQSIIFSGEQQIVSYSFLRMWSSNC